MRKQLLGATAVAAVSGALALGLPAAPSQAAAWKTLDPIPFPGGVVTDVDVVSTGPGDAIAAAIIGGDVHAYTATDGVWTTHAVVAQPGDASTLLLASSGSGDTVVGWEEDVAGSVRLRVRRHSGGAWGASATLTPDDTDINGTADLGIAADGRVIAAASIDGPDYDDRLIVTEWAEGAAPGGPEVLSPSTAFAPSLDVNAAGRAVVAFHYDGLVDDVLDVSVRTVGGDWSLPDNGGSSGNLASHADVAVSDNGTAQVVWSSVVNGFYVAETARVTAGGDVVGGPLVSPLDEYANDPSVDINADGSALFAWQAIDGGVEKVRYAAAGSNASPATSGLLTNTLTDAADPTARISDSGLRVIQHTGSGRVTTHYRSGAVQPFGNVTTGTGFHLDDAIDVDSEGNAVLAGFKPGVGVYGRFLDASGPSTKLTGPAGAQQLATTFPVSWTAADSLSTVTGTTLVSRQSAWNAAGFTDAEVAQQAVVSPAAFSGKPGTTYCLAVQAKDSSSNFGRRSAERCTTLPLDDVSLTGGKAWKRQKQAGHYLGTVTRTTKNGATLTRKGVKAKRLALVVQRSAKGGKVTVSFNGKSLGTFSLKGTGKKKVVNVETFGSVRAGTLKIKVVSPDGKQVAIDGLVVAK